MPLNKLLLLFSISTNSILIHSENAHSESKYLHRTNVHSAPGTMGTLYLTPPGGFMHLMNNDVAGDTDKLVTGTMQAGYTLNPEAATTYELSLHWRAVTPIFKTNTKGRKLENPIGFFADWIEAIITQAKIIDTTSIGKIRYQLSLGGSHIGNKGMKAVHRSLHKIVGTSLENLSYNNQPEGYHFSFDFQLGKILDLKIGGNYQENLFSIGYHDGTLIKELYSTYNGIFEISENTTLSFEFNFINHIDSNLYNDLNPNRHEAVLALNFFSIYSPSIKISSPLINGDKWGQSHISPLNFNFPL